MICRELGGACDMEFQAETLDDMAKQSSEHATQVNDELHNKIMEEMKDTKGTEAEKQWMEDMQKKFEAAPDA